MGRVGPVNTNFGPGPVKTNWGPESLNTNWGPRLGLGTMARVGSQAKGWGSGNTKTQLNYVYRLIFKEAAREAKEAAQSTGAEDFFELCFQF